MSEQDVIKETRPRMDTVIEDFRRKLATVRTGRAAVSLLDSVMVDYYGTMTPLNQMASVHAPEAALLTVQPWIKRRSLLSKRQYAPRTSASIHQTTAGL